MSKPKYIIDTIDYFISGDWGNEEASSDAPNRVRCIRGADINSANENNNASIPTRYISDNSKQKKLLSAGNIIVEKSGGSPTQSTGRVAYISDSIINDEDVVCSNFCAAFKVKDEYDPKYIYYYLKYMYNLGVFFNFEGKTSGIKNLQLEQAYGAIPIKDIKLPYQQKIASALSALDKNIELNNKIIKELETMSKELYDYWFVQFDFPNKDGKPYRTSGGAMTYNHTLKREIPLGWEVKTLDQVSTIVGGSTPSTENSDYFCEDGICWITPKDLSIAKGAKYIFNGGISLTELGAKSASLTTLPAGSILMSSRAPVGYLAIAANDTTTNQGLKSFMPDKGWGTNYLFETVKHIMPIIESQASGSTFKEVSASDVRGIKWYFPQSQISSDFEEQTVNINLRLKKSIQENQELTTLRDWLLPMLMNGQVTIQSEQSQSTKSECVTIDLTLQNKARVIPIDAHILGGHIVNRLYKPTEKLGRTKIQKAIHLTEYIYQLPLNSQAVQQTAGPYDEQLMRYIESKFHQFGHVKKETIKKNGKTTYNYIPTPAIDELEQAFDRAYADKKEMLDTLLDKLKAMDLGRIEIVSTLYAVWNNRLIKGEPIADELLFKDFYDWSPHKSDFSQDLVQRALNYMHRENIVPVGWGRYIDKK